MPSLRKRVTSYFRQLSFHNEPREKRHNLNENSFITKYLQGLITLREGPPILYGKNPTDLPNFELGHYTIGCETIVGCYTGPNGGLTSVKRTEKHLSVADPDIDFIDTQDESAASKANEQKSSGSKQSKTHRPLDNTTMVIRVAGQEYRVTTKHKKHNKSRSLGSLSDLTLDSPPGPGGNDSSLSPNDRFLLNANNNLVTVKKDAALAPNATTGVNNNNNSIFNNNNNYNTDNSNCDVTSREAAAAEEPNLNLKDVEQRCQEFATKEANCDINVGDGSFKGALSGGDGGGAPRRLYVGAVVDTERSQGESLRPALTAPAQNFGLAKSKSEGNPFQHKKKGKIIKIAQRTSAAAVATPAHVTTTVDGSPAPFSQAEDPSLPPEWNRKSDRVFGISESLYDKNQVTHVNNGDPIADCFGVIARNDSAILALADGVNWGEKAAIAAKSAIHGCLHYLNKTIFVDTKPFESLHTESSGSEGSHPPTPSPGGHGGHNVTDTKEVFICLLRAFNCAHDLILENQGMLTTLTVAVVLPLKGGAAEDADGSSGGTTTYVCCVCNVGDTLAYVYSQKYGIRELTKGSHNINANRDMRDALGALGPVDGINPELSNLTLSITTLQKGDIVLVASDGLTDNFDPNVCKFTVVNSVINQQPTNDKHHQDSSSNRQSSTKSRSSSSRGGGKPPLIPPSSHSQSQHSASAQQQPQSSSKPPPPQKPPREKAARRAAATGAAAGTTGVGPKAAGGRGSVDSTRSSQRSSSGGEGGGSLRRVSSSHKEASAATSHGTERGSAVDSAVTAEFSSDSCVDGPVSSKAVADSTSGLDSDMDSNPLVAQFLKENPVDRSPINKVPPQTALSHHHNTTAQTAAQQQQQPPQPQQYKPTPSVRSNKARRSSSHREAPVTSSQQQPQHGSSHHGHGKSPRSARRSAKGASSDQQQHPPQTQSQSRYAFLRSKTTLDGLRRNNTPAILRNEDGLPYVSPLQRYEINLLFMEDVLKRGTSGRDTPCTTARKLCESLTAFAFSITAAKRRTLEDPDFYFDNRNGVMIEVSAREKKSRRRRGLEKVQNLPGKLDHVSVVAYNVGFFAFSSSTPNSTSSSASVTTSPANTLVF